MIYKDLVAEGKLKKEKAIGIDQIHRFIKRAKKDLETAKASTFIKIYMHFCPG